MSVPFWVLFSSVNSAAALLTLSLFFYSHGNHRICTRKVGRRQCIKVSSVTFESNCCPPQESSVMIGSKVIWLVMLVLSAVGYVVIAALLLLLLFLWHSMWFVIRYAPCCKGIPGHSFRIPRKLYKPDRAEVFTDGIFAIAITIIVLDFDVPETVEWSQFGDLPPSVVSYAATFLILSSHWYLHFKMIDQVKALTHKSYWINNAFCFFVALIPFTDKLAALAMDSSVQVLERALATFISGLNIFLMAAFNIGFWRSILQNPLCWKKSSMPRGLSSFLYKATLVTLGTAMLVFGVSFLLRGWLATLLYFLIPIGHLTLYILFPDVDVEEQGEFRRLLN